MIHAAPRTVVLALGLALLGAPALLAQSGPMPPPALMQFEREEVKPGRGAPHAATEAAWARAARKGGSKDYYLGMTSLTGPSEAWFLVGHASYADWEAKQKASQANATLKAEIDRIAQQDGEQLRGTRTVLGAWRKELSYGPPVEIGKMRYMRIRTFRVKQGQTAAFEAGVKQALAAYEKSHFAGSFAFYEVVAGMGAPTFIALRPMASLTELDGMEAADKAFQEALGEEGQKAMKKVFTEAVAQVDTQLFAFNPRMSYAAPSVVASDPAFWTVKAPKAAK